MQPSFNKILSAALFIAFAGAVLFGAYAMGSGDGHSIGCIGAFENPNCATAVSPAEHFQYHLGALEGLSLGIVQQPFATLLLLTAFILALFLSVLPRDAEDQHSRSLFRKPEKIFAPQAPILRWLSLHEKRDPSFAYAMN